jgi:hypothetical protein
LCRRSSIALRTRIQRQLKPGHHALDFRARLGPVKALASLDPLWPPQRGCRVGDPGARAGGLDPALGRRPERQLRDGPANPVWKAMDEITSPDVDQAAITLPASTNGSKLRPMVGAVIYIRVSTKEQTENLSLSTQLKACEEYCQRQGFHVLARFREEGESAKTADRTELQKLLQFCRKNKGAVQFVVVFNLTRFARDKYDHFACARI